MKKYWFIQKTYGYGWTPATWQGWVCMGIYILAIAGAVYNLTSSTFQTSRVVITEFLPEISLYTLILIFVCFYTGETPRWKWGKEK